MAIRQKALLRQGYILASPVPSPTNMEKDTADVPSEEKEDWEEDPLLVSPLVAIREKFLRRRGLMVTSPVPSPIAMERESDGQSDTPDATNTPSDFPEESRKNHPPSSDAAVTVANVLKALPGGNPTIIIVTDEHCHLHLGLQASRTQVSP